MKRFSRLLIAGFLLCAFLLAGCGLSVENVMDVIAPTESPTPGSDLVFNGVTEIEAEPLRLTYQDMDGTFNPFWASADGDVLVAELTQLSLQDVSTITVDDREDGSTLVTVALQEGLTASDGSALDADDLLFTYYVLMDADYDGPSEVGTLPVRGLSSYWNGMDMDMYAKYIFLYDSIYNSGRYDQNLKDALEKARYEALNNGVKEEQLGRDAGVQAAQAALDEYDTQRAQEIREAMESAWHRDAQDIVNYIMEHYSASIPLRTPYTREEVEANPGLQVMYAMLDRSFGDLSEEDGSFTANSGAVWDLEGQFPTVEDFFDEMYTSYNGDAEQYWQLEGIGRPSMLAAVENELVNRWAPEDEEWRGPVNSIEGLEKKDERTLCITLEYCDEDILRVLTDVYLVSLDHYGDPELFDPAGLSFGFTRGNLQAVRALARDAFGGGEYVYRETDVRTVYLDANEHYWKGVSETPYVILTRQS